MPTSQVLDEAPATETPPALEDTEIAGVDEAPTGEVQPDEEPMDQASLTEDRSDDTDATVAADAASEEATTDAPSDDAEAMSEASPSEEDEGSLVVDTVDYDDEGDMTITGSSEPEADLHVYLDERHVGTIESDSAGDWEVSPDDEVAPGTYTLRVDQVDPAGVVLARIETPLTPRPARRALVWRCHRGWSSRGTASGASPGAPSAAASTSPRSTRRIAARSQIPR